MNYKNEFEIQVFESHQNLVWVTTHKKKKKKKKFKARDKSIKLKFRDLLTTHKKKKKG